LLCARILPLPRKDNAAATATAAGALAARALYVLEVTRREPGWADWNDGEPDAISVISPQASRDALNCQGDGASVRRAGKSHSFIHPFTQSLIHCTHARTCMLRQAKAYNNGQK
jgi:hypothetical protein